MNILPEVEEIYDEIVGIRRRIHSYPEPGFEEFKTAELICEFLRNNGIAFEKNISKTGVVASIINDPNGPTIALRADMDALELNEETGVDYASTRPGLMHGCGHDAHVAMLLGAAKILAGQKELGVNIKFIFQPAEESVVKPDYAGGGAELMVKEGVMDGVDAILALHVFGDYEYGTIGGWEDLATSSADQFKITVKGKGGHASTPHEGIDAIIMAAQVITALQTITSRMIDPLEPVVIGIGTVHGGTRHNNICDKVEMEGTVRTFSDDVRQLIPARMKDILAGIEKMNGGEIDLEYHMMYPVGRNDPSFSGYVHGIAASIVGDSNFILNKKPVTGSEDFWYFGELAPACFICIGSANKKKGIIHYNHHPKFNIDENCMKIGMTVLVRTVAEFLKK
ncbi:MAG: M20 metallopeptidase family protein [Candidatus Hodarchaeales archaeon]